MSTNTIDRPKPLDTPSYLLFFMAKKADKEEILSFDDFVKSSIRAYAYEPKWGSLNPTEEDYERYLSNMNSINQAHFEVLKVSVIRDRHDEICEATESREDFQYWITKEYLENLKVTLDKRFMTE